MPEQYQWINTWWRHQMETFSALRAFVRGIHRWPVNSPHKGQWRGALMFYLICAWINDRVNNRQADDLWQHCIHYDVIVMTTQNRETKWQNISSLHGVHEPPWHQWKCWPLEDAVVFCLWLVPGLNIQIIIVCKYDISNDNRQILKATYTHDYICTPG